MIWFGKTSVVFALIIDVEFGGAFPNNPSVNGMKALCSCVGTTAYLGNANRCCYYIQLCVTVRLFTTVAYLEVRVLFDEDGLMCFVHRRGSKLGSPCA